MHPAQKTNQSTQIRIGFAGLGGIAKRVHLPIVTQLDNVSVLAGAERDEYNRTRVGKLFNIEHLYSDYKVMIDSIPLNAIYICLPVSLHYDAVSYALNKGLHVFCEKPLGHSEEEAKSMFSCAHKNDKILFPGFNMRFVSHFVTARKIVKSGKLGKLIQVQAVFLNPGPYLSWDPKSDWHFEKNSGGALYDAGSHLINLLSFIMQDKIDCINGYSKQNHHGYTVITNTSGMFTTEKGIVGSIDIGWKSAVEYLQITLHGTGGTLIVNRNFLEWQNASTDPIDRIINHFKYAWDDINSLKSRIILLKKKMDIREEYVNESKSFIQSITENTIDSDLEKDTLSTHKILTILKDLSNL